MSEAQNGGNVMERLTFDGNFCDIAQCTSTPGGSLCEDGSCSARKVWERLKAYEDTHMMPSDVTSMRMDMAIIVALFNGVDVDRMKELAEADKEGRLVVLPCKVGTATYYIHYPIAVYPDESEPEIKRGIFTLCDLDRVGHSVFLAREEAEKALEGKRNA